MLRYSANTRDINRKKSPETEYEESLQQFQIISEQIEKLTVQDR